MEIFFHKRSCCSFLFALRSSLPLSFGPLSSTACIAALCSSCCLFWVPVCLKKICTDALGAVEILSSGMLVEVKQDTASPFGRQGFWSRTSNHFRLQKDPVEFFTFHVEELRLQLLSHFLSDPYVLKWKNFCLLQPPPAPCYSADSYVYLGCIFLLVKMQDLKLT